MKLASIRIITDDLTPMISFYENVTNITAERPAPVFAEFVSPTATLAIGDSQTVALFKEGSAHAADNHSVIIEWQVDDVDAEYARLEHETLEWVQTPATMPWGNRSALLRDPDGNLVNLYTPVTDDAKQRFAQR
jgi:catechol 2,3-dioxygenase-like lactoylglutathione lyase family enzyme